METNLAKRAIISPLVGLVVGWALFMFAFYANLFVLPEFDSQGYWVADAQVVRPATYLFLAGIVVFGLASLYGQRLALRARELAGPDHLLARAAHRFTTLTVIIGLVGGAIYAIGNFLGAFNVYSDRRENLLVRLFDVYVPILLATVLVVYILLRAFVFRKTNVKGAKKQKMSESEKALGLGYAVPIIFTAIAIIFGLAVYDVTRTDLQVWVWVVIQVIIGSGVLLGTRFSRRAKAARAAAPRPRATLAAGASNLNFVLSIIFGAVVSIMAFGFGGSAVDKLRYWPEFTDSDSQGFYSGAWEVSPFSIGWFTEEMLPALILLLLAALGTYLSITERNKEVAAVPVSKSRASAKPKAKPSAKKTK